MYICQAEVGTLKRLILTGQTDKKRYYDNAKHDNYIESNTQHRIGLYLQLKGTEVSTLQLLLGTLILSWLFRNETQGEPLPSRLSCPRVRWRNLPREGNLRSSLRLPRQCGRQWAADRDLLAGSPVSHGF